MTLKILWAIPEDCSGQNCGIRLHWYYNILSSVWSYSFNVCFHLARKSSAEIFDLNECSLFLILIPRIILWSILQAMKYLNLFFLCLENSDLCLHWFVFNYTKKHLQPNLSFYFNADFCKIFHTIWNGFLRLIHLKTVFKWVLIQIF